MSDVLAGAVRWMECDMPRAISDETSERGGVSPAQKTNSGLTPKRNAIQIHHSSLGAIHERIRSR